jgi:hypothetical protein
MYIAIQLNRHGMINTTKETNTMGLFTKGNNYCIICGSKVSKKSIFLSDGERICTKCNNKVYSSYVYTELKKDNVYPDINTSKMKQMQDFFEESAKRAEQFVTTFKSENLYIDETHGWFFILRRESYRYYSDIKEILKSPIEIFSVNDVERIEYHAHRFAFDGKNYEFYHFKLKNQLLPYIPYNVVELSMKRDQSFRLDVKFRLSFPNAEVDIPDFGMPAIVRTVFIEERETLDYLPAQRKALNEQIDRLMVVSLPEKCKPLAKQYLTMDNQLLLNLELLKDSSNFENDILLKENITESKSYLTQMIKIYQEIEKIVIKQMR